MWIDSFPVLLVRGPAIQFQLIDADHQYCVGLIDFFLILNHSVREVRNFDSRARQTEQTVAYGSSLLRRFFGDGLTKR